MRVVCFLMGLLLLMVACWGGGESRNVVSGQLNSSGIVITVVDGQIAQAIDTLRLGRLLEGEKVETGYFVKNSSEEPLVLANSVTGCGCTQMRFSRKPILPGDSSFVKLTYDSKDKYGQQILDIDLITADYRVLKLLLMVEVVDNN